MTSTNHRKVIILGSGPAGLTAAIYTARANLSPLLLHGPLPGGQLTTTTAVENFPGFPDGVQGPDLMQMMEKQAVRFGTSLVQGMVNKIDLSKRPFTLESSAGVFTAEALILATGASPKQIGLPNEKELTGYGVSTCATCDGAFFRDKVIAVVGGGDSACEEATFLSRFGSKVYLIHRRGELRASKIMQDRIFKNPKIQPLWFRHVVGLKGTKETGLTALTLENTEDNTREDLTCDGLFVAIGHTPNSALVSEALKCDKNGYIIPEPNSTRTNIAGVFACGDVQDHVFRQAITAAGSGCMAAIEAERFLGD